MAFGVWVHEWHVSIRRFPARSREVWPTDGIRYRHRRVRRGLRHISIRELAATHGRCPRMAIDSRTAHGVERLGDEL
jgi:hypothetical protein